MSVQKELHRRICVRAGDGSMVKLDLFRCSRYRPSKAKHAKRSIRRREVQNGENLYNI